MVYLALEIWKYKKPQKFSFYDTYIVLYEKSHRSTKKSYIKISLRKLELTNQVSVPLKHISKANLFFFEENSNSFSSHINTHKKQCMICKYSSDKVVPQYILLNSILILPVVAKLLYGKNLFHHTILQHGKHNFQSNLDKFLFSVFKMKLYNYFSDEGKLVTALSCKKYLNHKFQNVWQFLLRGLPILFFLLGEKKSSARLVNIGKLLYFLLIFLSLYISQFVFSCTYEVLGFSGII